MGGSQEYWVSNTGGRWASKAGGWGWERMTAVANVKVEGVNDRLMNGMWR